MKKKKSDLLSQDYRSLFENASDAIWVHDLDGRIAYANRAAEKLTGYSHDDIIGMDVVKLLSDAHSHDIARDIRRRLLAAEDIVQPYEQRIVRKDGSIAMWRMATSLVSQSGVVVGFQHIARDVTAERQVQDNMRSYVQEVIRAQEDERKRVARELHDEVSPSLLMLIRGIDAILTNAKLRLSEVMKQKLEDLRCQTVEALESTRRIAQDLRPRILDDLGLIPALEWMADNLIKKHGIEAKVSIKGEERYISPDVQLLVFRIAQEALNNVRKHSGASEVCMDVDFNPIAITVSIADNGKGFVPPSRAGELTSIGKLGLAGMQERAQLLGGSISIKSWPGEGSAVTIEVPTVCPLPQNPTYEALGSLLPNIATGETNFS